MGFAQQLRGQSRRRGVGRGGKALLSLRFGHRWSPGPTPSWVRLIPESHVIFDGTTAPYFEYLEHFAARTNKGFICGRGWKEVDNGRGGYDLVGNGDCCGCLELDIPQGTSEWGPNHVKDVSFARKAAFLGLHLEDYHMVEARDRRGNILTYELDTRYHKKGDTIMRRVLCERRNCKFCKERYDKVFGKLIHWSIGGGHLKGLSSFADELERECKYCGEELEAQMYLCPTPGCENTLLDMQECEYNDDQLLDITSRPLVCQQCNNMVMMAPIYDHRHNVECRDPKPTELFDVDIYVKKVGGGKGSFPVLDFVKHRVGEVDESVVELLPTNKDDERVDVLHRIFKQDPIKQQCDVLNMKDPFGTADDHSKAYGKPDDTPDEGPADDDIPY